MKGNNKKETTCRKEIKEKGRNRMDNLKTEIGKTKNRKKFM